MSALLEPYDFISAADAVDALRGELPVYATDYSEMPRERLVEVVNNLNSVILEMRVQRGLIALQIARAAGDLPTDRRRALEEFAAELETPISVQVLMTDLRMVRFLTPEQITQQFGLLRVTHIQDAIRLTSRAGEAPDAPERRERVVRALNEAVDSHESTGAFRERLRAEQAQADRVLLEQSDGSEVLAPHPADDRHSYVGERALDRTAAEAADAQLRDTVLRLQQEVEALKQRTPDPATWGDALGDAIFASQDEFGQRKFCREFGRDWFAKRLRGAW